MIFARSLALALAVSVAAGQADAATLATPLSGGNRNAGIQFDVLVGPRNLTLTALAVNIGTAFHDYAFYTIFGGIGSNSANAAAWTLRDSFTDVSGQSSSYARPGEATMFDIGDLQLAANTRYGFYFTATTRSGSTRVIYSNQAMNTVVTGHSDITVFSGIGKRLDFGGGNMGRAFNGTLAYSVDPVPEPASWGMLITGFGFVGAAARCRRAAGIAIA
ncbi:PEPxxWA-CTERM sorting domain-containing protein [Sandarakinorhabdus sp.]|uniref:PEPxxWA-CTERM sorting domain-containing protein n=1 Tax=Sandarakinorhabdus sp. TaxID=1916663 RepID=UPI003340468B